MVTCCSSGSSFEPVVGVSLSSLKFDTCDGGFVILVRGFELHMEVRF